MAADVYSPKTVFGPSTFRDRLRRGSIAATLLGLSIGMAGALAADASPARSWSIVPSADAKGRVNGLSGVSCPAPNACIAVGSHNNKAGKTVPLAEAWNGSKWTIQPTPSPPGALSSDLSAVSCSSPTACIAVGSTGYFTNGTFTGATLAEAWDGTSWTILPTPNPGAATLNYLLGVSCTSATACTAVGYSTFADGPDAMLAERWDGTNWTIQPTPDPTGSQGSRAAAVSCTSPTACTAVGSYNDAAGVAQTLAEAWNGTHWTIQPTPVPSGAGGSYLTGISCLSASACTAVGYSLSSSFTFSTLAEVWNGTDWKIQPTPSPAGARGSLLTAVSCPTPTACTAVGYTSVPGAINGFATLAEVWNGTGWSVQHTPDPAGAAASTLRAVSCTSPTGCTAVGTSTKTSSGDQMTLAEAWNGTRWAFQPTPDPTGTMQSSLSAVSCVSAVACTAVGSSVSGSGTSVTLAEVWNGTRWSIQPTPNPSGALSNNLAGVSCPSPTACMAVGSYLTSTFNTATLAEVWNGTGWSILPTPDPTGEQDSSLSAVSCTSPTACTAVGSSTDSAGNMVTLAETWNGMNWTIQSTPNPSGALAGSLSGVSCTSAGACTAVGTYTDSTATGLTLAEAWNGTAWTIQPTPSPGGALDSALSGVSCSSRTACTAVGSSLDAAGNLGPLAEAWDGVHWTIEATSTPASGQGPLTAVSCSAPTACSAVGFSTDSTGTIGVTLAEVWNGTRWKIRPSADPAGSVAASLSGVSCTSPRACIAVGSYFDGGTHTLVERYH